MFEAPDRVADVISSFIDECVRAARDRRQSTG